MGVMAEGELAIRRVVESTAAHDHVGSVASLAEIGGNLSTGAVIAIMQQFAAEGLVYSTRGPKGGYWRTTKPMRSGPGAVTEELREVAELVADLAGRLPTLTRLVESVVGQALADAEDDAGCSDGTGGAGDRPAALTNQLIEELGMWGDCVDFPRHDWKAEVAADATNLGYWDWVAAKYCG